MTTKNTKQTINGWKYVIAGVIGLLIFFSVRSCVEKQRVVANAMVKSLEKQVEKAKDGTQVALQEQARLKDSIKLEDIKKKEKLKEFAEKQLASEEKVKLLELEAKKAKQQVKNMNLVQVAQSLNEIYGGNNAVATSNSVDTRGSLPYQLVETAIEVNSVQDIVKEKDKQITVKDSVIYIKDQQLKDSSLNLFSAEKTVNSYRELSGLQTELNKNLEKENSKLRTKSWLNKMMVPVGVAIGILIGRQ